MRGGWVILLSLLAAMLLGVVRLPEDWPSWLGWLRPQWILLVLFFWVMELPERIGLVSAWILGLLVDALVGEPLGLNGILLAGVTFVTWRFFERLRMYSALQQCGVVFLLVLGIELVRGVVLGWSGNAGLSWGVVVMALASVCAWPLVYLLLIRVKTAIRVE